MMGDNSICHSSGKQQWLFPVVLARNRLWVRVHIILCQRWKKILLSKWLSFYMCDSQRQYNRLQNYTHDVVEHSAWKTERFRCFHANMISRFIKWSKLEYTQTTANTLLHIGPKNWVHRVKVLHPTRRKVGHFRDVLGSQSLGIVLKKLNLRQEKQTTQEQDSLSRKRKHTKW